MPKVLKGLEFYKTQWEEKECKRFLCRGLKKFKQKAKKSSLPGGRSCARPSLSHTLLRGRLSAL